MGEKAMPFKLAHGELTATLRVWCQGAGEGFRERVTNPRMLGEAQSVREHAQKRDRKKGETTVV